jgi:bifunctional isochorismate lyase/aryl carrier protein
MSPDLLRATVADLLDEPVGDDDDLFDAGLDSIRLMTVVEHLRAGGHDVSFVDLAERPTLAAWVDLLGGPA